MTPAGSRIGKYEIQGELGRGAFTRVYRGHDPTVGRPVAIKVLLDESDPDLAAQFRQQAAAAANLHHKNIVAIYELGEHGGVPFIAMEYLEGIDLRQVIAQGNRLTLLQKMLIMWQVADALQCAHQTGAVHLDLKPANIMLLPDGVVKMMDFGMVRLSEERVRGLSAQEYLDQEMLYLAPEQISSSGAADKLGDIFAYGVIYYELLAGKHPFAAPDARGVMSRIGRDEPEALSGVLLDCPEGFDGVVARALEKDRELRYQSVEDLQFDIEPVLGELKKQRAETLLEQARRMLAVQEQLDAARGLLREALELEPGNREARRLLERIREQQQRQMIHKRVEELREQAHEALRARRFEEAVESLEAALRLDAADQDLAARLEEARGWLERSRRAAALVEDARYQIQQQRLEEARGKIQQALENDPQHVEAARLLERVDKEIAERERERRLQEGLVKAQCLVLAESFDEAIALLLELQNEHPRAKQVQDRLAEARRDKAARERQQRLDTGLASARESLEKQRFAEAVERLEALSEEFGGEPEARKLLAEAREELQKHERAQAVQKVRNQAMDLAASGDFVGAIEVLAHGLKSFPEEGDLRRVLRVLEDTAMDLSSQMSQGKVTPELEAERFMRDTLTRVGILEDRQQWRTALTVLEQALERCPHSPELALAHSRVKNRCSDTERRQKLARRLEVIQQKMGEQAWLPAILLIEASLAEFPDEPELKRLLERAHAARQFADCENVIASIHQSLADGDLEQAESILQTAADAYPTDPRLPSLRQELDREKIYHSEFRDAEVLFSRHRFNEAEAILLALKARKPLDADVQALLETVRLERIPQEDKQHYNQGREQAMAFVRNGEFDRALEVLRKLLTRFPEDSVLKRDLSLVVGAQTQQRTSADPVIPDIMNQLVPITRSEAIFSAEAGGAHKRVALIVIPLLFLILLVGILIWRTH